MGPEAQLTHINLSYLSESIPYLTAQFGGALSLLQEMASFEGVTLFFNNTAKDMEELSKRVFNVLEEVKFEFNFAQRGGGMQSFRVMEHQ